MSLLPLLTLALLLAGPLPHQITPPSTSAAPPTDEPIAPLKLVYPADARAARIEGVVEVQVEVDRSGRVTHVEALSGPIALRQAAIDAFTEARYRPLLKQGVPTTASIRTAVRFSLQELPPDNDLLVDREFEPVHARCQQLSADHDASALGACRQAVELARRFSPTAQLEARASALNDLVLLLIANGKRSKDLPEAASLADEAVALVGRGGPHTPAVAVAYITRAEVRSLAGALPGAAADCAAAEEVLTTLVNDERENERAGNYRVQLRETLLLHAVVLERDHHPFEAARLRRRSATI